MIRPQRLGKDTLPENELKEDKKSCHKFGPCGVGQKAISLNSFYIDRGKHEIECVERDNL